MEELEELKKNLGAERMKEEKVRYLRCGTVLETKIVNDCYLSRDECIEDDDCSKCPLWLK